MSPQEAPLSPRGPRVCVHSAGKAGPGVSAIAGVGWPRPVAPRTRLSVEVEGMNPPEKWVRAEPPEGDVEHKQMLKLSLGAPVLSGEGEHT